MYYMATVTRPFVIQTRVTEAAHKIYSKAADQSGMTLSAWVRKVLADHARAKGLVKTP